MAPYAAWQFFQQMLADVTKIVTEDAESERELLEGLRVIARVSSLCSQMSVEADLGRPVVLRHVLGQPDDRRSQSRTATTSSAMIRGDRRYRITGTRGTTAYLGFQILAGTGLTPRRMSSYVSDVDLALESAINSRWCCRLRNPTIWAARSGCRFPTTRRRSSSANTSVIAPPKSWPPCGSRRSTPTRWRR